MRFRLSRRGGLGYGNLDLKQTVGGHQEGLPRPDIAWVHVAQIASFGALFEPVGQQHVRYHARKIHRGLFQGTRRPDILGGQVQDRKDRQKEYVFYFAAISVD